MGGASLTNAAQIKAIQDGFGVEETEDEDEEGGANSFDDQVGGVVGETEDEDEELSAEINASVSNVFQFYKAL